MSIGEVIDGLKRGLFCGRINIKGSCEKVCHKDPFDRLIIAQARYEGFQLLTNDLEFNAYGIPILW